MTGELSENQIQGPSLEHVRAVFLTPMYSLQGTAPVLSRFETCFVNRAVLLDKPACVFSGRYVGHGTMEQKCSLNWRLLMLKVSLSVQ